MHKHLFSILLASLLVAFITTSHAQTRPRQTPAKPVAKTPPTPQPDLLVRQDGTQLEVLVTEITDKEIVYKRFSNLNGPVFRVQKADFSFIKYGSNGEIERFTTAVQPAPVPVQPAPTPAQAVPTLTQAAQTRPTSNAPAPAYQPRPASSSKKTRFGLFAGGQSAIISFDGSTEVSKSIFGFRGGLLFDRSLGSVVSLRSQALYSAKGCNLSHVNLKNYYLNYLEIPVDLLYRIQTPRVQFLLGGGAYLGKLLNAKIGTQDAGELFPSTDIGLRASGWAELPSGLTINIFYGLGLSNVSPLSSTWKNRTFGFGVGYFLFKY